MQANAPYAALHHILYLSQSPHLPALLAELDSHLSSSSTTSPLSLASLSSSQSLPLLTSTLYETLRLSSSSFSIRIVQDPAGFLFPSPGTAGHLIPRGARVVCATRVAHLTQEARGEEWDGERFVGEEERRRAAREVRAFGGGISVVRCVLDSHVSLSGLCG